MTVVLFIRLRLLGDIVFTIPSIEIFRKKFPESKIYYVVEERYQEIAGLIPHIDRVITVPNKMTVRDFFRFRRLTRSMAIDAVIDFHSGPRSALLTRISGANLRIGYRTPNRNWAYNRLSPRKRGESYTHSAFNQAQLLTHVGVETEKIPPYPAIGIDPDTVSPKVTTIVQESEGRQRITLHVGAGNSLRDWGTDRFGALVKRLVEDDVSVFLVGAGNAEAEKGQSLARRYGVHDLTNQLSIVDMLHVVSMSKVFVGADSGPLHVASLTTTPLVALYGPNIPEISGPWRQKDVTILQVPMECRPCRQRQCIFQSVRCMQSLAVDDVYTAIMRYLNA